MYSSISQHGIMRGKSTDTPLVRFYDFVTHNLDNNLIVDAIFFDLAKAFDKVPHGVLVQRLYECGICGALLDWLQEFLSNRFQRVRFAVVVQAVYLFRVVPSGDQFWDRHYLIFS